jgi:hypothetical protein
MADRLWTLPNVIFSIAETYYEKPYADLHGQRQDLVKNLLCWHLNYTMDEVIRAFWLPHNNKIKRKLSPKTVRRELDDLDVIITDYLLKQDSSVHGGSNEYDAY